MRKGQSTVEMLTLTGFMFIVFLVVLSVGSNQLISLQEESRRSQLLETAEFLENEIHVAIEAEEGYIRDFELPGSLGGEDYVIEFAEGENFTEVILKFMDDDVIIFEKTLLVSPRVNGTMDLNPEGMTTVHIAKTQKGIGLESEYIPSECDDGIDNDGDGYTDYPSDTGCTGLSDSSELGTVECDDGVDNDFDEATDYPDDEGCSDSLDDDETNCGDNRCEGGEDSGSCPTDCPAGPAACDDGIDNDYDGSADYPNDPGCANALDDDETKCGDSMCEYGEHRNNCASDCPETGECNDGIDNDGDGDKDYHMMADHDSGCTDRSDTDETDCGDGVCEGGENSVSCTLDCT